MTAEELAAWEKQAHISDIEERNRPYTSHEVMAMLIPRQINTLTVDDATALRMKGFYPEWAVGTEYGQGFKVRRHNKLWRVLQPHSSRAGWEPENVPSLWEEINEAHSGTVEDPVPYDGNMALEQGKYYYQGGAIYLCVRDTGNPVYHPLAQLIGIYVKEV